MALNTCGNSEVSTNFLKESRQSLARSGIAVSTVCSRSEPLVCWRSQGKGATESSEPISHAITSTDSALVKVPPTASTVRAGSQVTWLRTTAPIVEDANWPMTAARNTITMASNACSVEALTTAWAIGGAIRTPRKPPPTKPRKLKAPMMKPCR